MKWTAVACASNYFHRWKGICALLFFFPRQIFIHYRPFCLCTIRIFHFERTSWIYSAFVTLLFVAWYLFFPLSFFLNNLNNRINKCLLFDVNCETVGRGCNKNSQLLYNMNIYIYILDNLVFKFFADNVSDAWIKA